MESLPLLWRPVPLSHLPERRGNLVLRRRRTKNMIVARKISPMIPSCKRKKPNLNEAIHNLTLTMARMMKFEIKTGIVVTNSFFLDIAEPGKWFKVEDKLHFDWDKSIASYVTGKTKGKNLKLELGRDVDMVYAPMMWGADHWYVGYTIHHVKEERRYYSWSRLVGIYHNGRASDYGTRATKFIEMHANGDGKEKMSLITDQIVDRFREKYAMDCYEEFISDFRVTNKGSMK
ncbi:hypothetical protein DY000_02021630 [Brassica cretica]|uniref:Ubiquitin-like protease family profile domain-containing protein n=1 Tax=Brassica cretica TaxID=69181 RepID=A0ABQ7E8X1_BRACR|nr:hypothetical protein DY000_02021630 [Brassica cretica]